MMSDRAPKIERNRQLFERHSKGESYGQLAKEYGLGRERVRQIVQRVERYGEGWGYAALAAARVWRLASLSNQEELFALTDDEILAIPGVGLKTLKVIRELQHEKIHGRHRDRG
jgi:hypothetical protein